MRLRAALGSPGVPMPGDGEATVDSRPLGFGQTPRFDLQRPIATVA